MAEPIRAAAVKLVESPVLFFQDRVAGPPRWASPIAALACCCALLAMAGAVSTARALGGFRADAAILVSVVGIGAFAFLFALQTGTVVCIERLFSTARNGRRLVECSALAYWTQVPLVALGVGFWAMMESSPEPVLPPANAGTGALLEAIEAGAADQEAQAWRRADTRELRVPAQILFENIAACYSIWVVALQAAALRAVSQFSIAGASAAGLLLGTLFVVLPWAL